MATQPHHVRGRLMPGERFPTGMRPGRRRAQGSDLDSIGPYAPGDDIRWMDWRATARTGRAQMKRFVAESHLARMLIVDFGAHLLFGTETRPMAKTGALLAAQLAWEAFTLQEPVGMVVVPDQLLVQPRRGRGHILFLLKHLEDCYCTALSGTENDGFSRAEHDVLSRAEHDGLSRAEHDSADELVTAIDTASGVLGSGDEICVFSDFGDESPRLSAKVRALNAIRHFRAIIVEDPMFHRAVPSGRYPYKGANDSHRSVATVPKSGTNAHQNAVSDLRSELRRRLIADGWRITEAAKHGFLLPGAQR
ncbi:MAG: DUF58 domain-containing protein [Hyphomicrobiaceae bacterium]